MSDEDKLKVFQVAVDLGYVLSDNLEKYKEFLDYIQIMRKEINMMGMGQKCLIGDYDPQSHEFFSGSRENTRTFAKKLEGLIEKGIIKAVHINEF